MAYVALYRRYRSQRFDELKGQEHVVTALKSAVRESRVGHAYLFSGPRGTGKTTTARLLAKVLNCTNVVDDEPCNECESCTAITAGSSFDLVELDAASNNKVDDIRELIERARLASPGETKVYILDEVHMLTTGASNALLKTLEDPPEHVKFVLATTDPQKVLPTIKSRTQHFEFRLLSQPELAEHVRWVADDAGLDIDDEAVNYVVRQARGSARDALSVLDTVAASGLTADTSAIDRLLTAIAGRTPDEVLGAIDAAVSAGREPRIIAEDLVGRLRGGFLAAFSAPAAGENTDPEAAEVAAALGPGGITRALEGLSDALIDMRQVSEPRVVLEVALIRLARPDLDTSPAALVERIGRLEAALQGGAALPAAPAAAPDAPRRGGGGEATRAPSVSADPAQDPGIAVAESTAPSAPSAMPPADTPGGPAAAARARLAEFNRGGARPSPAPAPAVDAQAEARGGVALGGVRSGEAPQAATPAPPEPVQAPPPEAAAPATAPAPEAAAPPAGQPGESSLPSRDDLTLAWADQVLTRVSRAAKARFVGGRFVGVHNGVAQLALANQVTCDRCEAFRPEVEQALADHFGVAVPLALVVDGEEPGHAGDTSREAPNPAASAHQAPQAHQAPAGQAGSGPDVVDVTEPAEPAEEDVIDLTQLTDATDVAATGVDRILDVFPGARVVDPKP